MKKIDEYMNLPLSEIEQRIDKNDADLQKIWKNDDGSSWENYCKKCQPYWDDNKLLCAVRSVKFPMEEVKMRPLEDWEKDEKWVHIKINIFKEWCKSGFVTSYDGSGVYATEDEVSDLGISTWGIANGYVRKDFTHVCWYNK